MLEIYSVVDHRGEKLMILTGVPEGRKGIEGRRRQVVRRLFLRRLRRRLLPNRRDCPREPAYRALSFGLLHRSIGQTLQGSSSAVSKPSFARKYHLNMRLEALAEIYTMHSFAPFWNPPLHRSLISIFSSKITIFFLRVN